MNAEPVKRLSYLNIEISERGLSEFNSGKRAVFIPKEQICKIETRFGSAAERPGLQLAAGALLAGMGVAGIAMIAASGMRGVRWGYGFIFFGCMGAWLLYETFISCHYLLVTCQSEIRKLVFHGKFDACEFSKIAKNAAELGYPFQVD
jgi:hypothetical protein